MNAFFTVFKVQHFRAGLARSFCSEAKCKKITKIVSDLNNSGGIAQKN
jgi:hypothetical protein